MSFFCRRGRKLGGLHGRHREYQELLLVGRAEPQLEARSVLRCTETTRFDLEIAPFPAGTSCEQIEHLFDFSQFEKEVHWCWILS